MVAVYAKRPEVMHVYPPWKIWKGLHDRCSASRVLTANFCYVFFVVARKTIKERGRGKGFFLFKGFFLGGDFPM